MALRSLIAVRRIGACLLHHRTKVEGSNQVYSVNRHGHQRFLCTAFAPSDAPTRTSDFPVSNAYKEEHIIALAKVAVCRQNAIEDECLKFVRVVTAAHCTLDSGVKYQIILEVSYGKGERRFYSTTVWDPMSSNVMEFVDWGPVHDPSEVTPSV